MTEFLDVPAGCYREKLKYRLFKLRELQFNVQMQILVFMDRDAAITGATVPGLITMETNVRQVIKFLKSIKGDKKHENTPQNL